MKRLFATLLVAVLLCGLLAPTGAMAVTQYATVTGGWLRLRSAASFNASTINSYYTGTQVLVLDTTGNWYHVEAPDGQRGYMYGDYLSVGGVTPTPSGNTNATVVSSNGYGVRMRSGPGTGYRILRKFAVGTRAEILDAGSYWARVNIGGLTGYMMTQFLNKDGYVPPVYDGDATVWSANGYGVRLRSGPGTGYSKIGVYSVGTQVRILEKGYTWDKVQIGSRIGYMMNQFLIYNNNYQVTGVSINNYNPIVGNVLAIQTISPASATVTYQWYVGGVAKAGETRASYTVAKDDVGKAIQLAVTGAGSYTGTATSSATAAVLDTGTVTAVTLNNAKPVVGDTLKVASITDTNATVTYKWTVGTKTSTAASYLVLPEDKGQSITLTVTGTGNFTGTASVVTSAVTETGAIDSVAIQNVTNPGKAPDVGDTIKAVPTPSTATVTYAWTVGAQTFTTETIQVKDATWNGQTISLTVSGTGKYANTAASTSVNIGTPALTVGAVSFGEVQQGYAQPAAKYLRVENTGDAKAIVTNVKLSNANFVITPTSSQTVAAKTVVENIWAVQPVTGLTSGSYITDITLTYGNNLTVTQTVAINVTAAAPKLEIDNVTFNDVWQGTTPLETKSVTIRNTGLLAAEGVVISLEGDDANAFTISGTPSATIPAGGATSIQLTPNANAAAAISYDATLKAVGTNAAPVTASVKYRVKAKPILTVEPITATVAQGEAVDILLKAGAGGMVENIYGTCSNGDFTLTPHETTIMPSTLGIWKLTPKSTLLPGTYTGTLTFTYSGYVVPATANFSITVNPAVVTYVAVTDITGVPTAATAGTALTLAGTVAPATATNQTIAWTVENDGGTGTSISGNSLTAANAGTVRVKATIANGATASTDYTKSFDIIVNAASTYVAVTDITSVPTAATTGTPLTLSGTVAPATATNQTIAWTVENDGGTGASISGNSLTAANAGTVRVKATIANGATASTDYTKSFDITVSAASTYVAVTGITGGPTAATAGTPLPLTGTVEPSNATNQTIVWDVEDAGTTGATISGNTLSATAAGTAKVRATITNGASESTPYTQSFDVIVDAAASNALEPVQLATPIGLVWNNGVASWTAVDHATSYNVQLSSGESASVSATSCDFGFGTSITAPGSYTFTVTAVSTDTAYTTTSGTSETSGAYDYTVKLNAPIDPVWDTTIGKTAKWSNVSHATSYSVQLWLNGALHGTAVTATDGTVGVDLAANMTATGSYTFTVTAMGGAGYTASDASAASQATPV